MTRPAREGCGASGPTPGGVIDFHQETIDDQPAAVLASVARIGAITRDVLRCRDRRHPVERRGRHRPGADPAGQRRRALIR
jgi:hypothetical protein